MTPSEAPASLTPSSLAASPPEVFGWGAAIRDLFRLHAPPPGLWRAGERILLANAVLIVLCIVVGRWFYNDAHEMFRAPSWHVRDGRRAGVAGIVCFKIRNRVRGQPIAAFWLAFGILMCLAGGTT